MSGDREQMHADAGNGTGNHGARNGDHASAAQPQQDSYEFDDIPFPDQISREEFEELKGEMLRQKIIFDSAMRRQKDVFESRMDWATLEIERKDTEIRALRTAISVIGDRLTKVEALLQQQHSGLAHSSIADRPDGSRPTTPRTGHSQAETRPFARQNSAASSVARPPSPSRGPSASGAASAGGGGIRQPSPMGSRTSPFRRTESASGGLGPRGASGSGVAMRSITLTRPSTLEFPFSGESMRPTQQSRTPRLGSAVGKPKDGVSPRPRLNDSAA